MRRSYKIPVIEGKKVCGTCLENKPLVAFSFRGRPHQDTLRSVCRTCSSSKAKSTIARRSHLKNKYDFTLEEFNKLAKSQNFRCAICNSDDPKTCKKGNFCIDHDHRTGKVRGLLCDLCNKGLGQFKESLSLLRNAVLYLEKHSSPSPEVLHDS